MARLGSLIAGSSNFWPQLSSGLSAPGASDRRYRLGSLLPWIEHPAEIPARCPGASGAVRDWPLHPRRYVRAKYSQQPGNPAR